MPKHFRIEIPQVDRLDLTPCILNWIRLPVFPEQTNEIRALSPADPYLIKGC